MSKRKQVEDPQVYARPLAFLTLLAIVLAWGIIVTGQAIYHDWATDAAINHHPAYATGHIGEVSSGPSKPNSFHMIYDASYSFKASDGRTYQNRVATPKDIIDASLNNDSLIRVRYASDNPRYNLPEGVTNPLSTKISSIFVLIFFLALFVACVKTGIVYFKRLQALTHRGIS